MFIEKTKKQKNTKYIHTTQKHIEYKTIKNKTTQTEISGKF